MASGTVLLRFRILPAVPVVGVVPTQRTVDVVVAGDTVRLGRSAGLEVPLPFPTVSGLHARLQRGELGVWVLEDAGSANGTFVHNRRLESGEQHRLRPGEEFRLADVTITFDGEPPPGPVLHEGVAPESTGSLARRLVADLFGVAHPGQVPRLVVEGGAGTTRFLALAGLERPFTVGRGPTCDLVLVDDDVSREHAQVVRRADGVFLRDLGSRHGTRVGGQRIDGERRLQDGDRIQIGASTLVMEDPEERYLRKIEEAAPEPPAPPRPRRPTPVRDIAAERTTSRSERTVRGDGRLRASARPPRRSPLTTALLAVGFGVLAMVGLGVALLVLGAVGDR